MFRARVLVVEDEAIVADDIRDRLTRLRFTVVGVVGTGLDALRLVGETAPDLVLMDIRLRGAMDGIQTAEEIGRRHRTPVIYLTADSDEDTFQRAKITEPLAYLLKPLDERELEMAIEMGLYRAKVERERGLLVAQLQEALERVKLLSGPLPICAWCKQIRDDHGYWQKLEVYIEQHSEVHFSHGVCPDCEVLVLTETGLAPPSPAGPDEPAASR